MDQSDEFAWTYLEASPKVEESEKKKWGDDSKNIEDTSEAIGTGKANTVKILAELDEKNINSAEAAEYANDLEHGGYDDWYLPSLDELQAMHDNLHDAGQGDFRTTFYWSSSEYYDSVNHVNGFHFGDNDSEQYNKSHGHYIRPIRSF